MIKIGSPYKDYYYIDNNKVYDMSKRKYIKSYNNRFSLKTEDNKRINVTLKTLYYKVYNKVYCEDDIKDLDNEQWKEIENCNGNYYISNCGRVKSYKGYKAKLLKYYTTNKGYKTVSINIGLGFKTYYIHRLVAQYFLPLPEKAFMEIHHKDYNTLNNKADNLIWITKEDHIKIHNEK